VTVRVQAVNKYWQPPDRPAIQAAVTESLTYLNNLNATELAADAPAGIDEQCPSEHQSPLPFGFALRPPKRARLSALLRPSKFVAVPGIAASAIDRVFLTGGSSLVPSVRSIFAERFGGDHLRGGDELTTVARGLAMLAASES
jgi:hypothetical protein